jgi:hypothetical protein
MVKEEIGGRPVDITKEAGAIKVIFHPMAKNATKPNAITFSLKLTKADLEKFKKAF